MTMMIREKELLLCIALKLSPSSSFPPKDDSVSSLVIVVVMLVVVVLILLFVAAGFSGDAVAHYSATAATRRLIE
jgi:hypothetical protein